MRLDCERDNPQLKSRGKRVDGVVACCKLATGVLSWQRAAVAGWRGWGSQKEVEREKDNKERGGSRDKRDKKTARKR